MQEAQRLLALERNANRELAVRLSIARKETDDARRELHSKVVATTSPVSATPGTWAQELLLAQRCGLTLDEVTPLAAVAAALASLRPAPHASLRRGDGHGLLDVLGAGPVFDLIVSAVGPQAGVPLLDAFAVVGPDPQDVAAAMRAHWDALVVQGCGEGEPQTPAIPTPHVLATLPPRVLHLTAGDGQTTVESATAAGLPDFACPAGGCRLLLKDPQVEIARCASRAQAPPKDRNSAAAQAILEAFLERNGLRRGPRTHAFVLNDGLFPSGLHEGEWGAARHAGRVVCPTSPVLASRTRYALCVTSCEPLTRGMLTHGGAEDSAHDAVVLIPRVFVLVSRYPFYTAHFEILRAAVRAWHGAVLEDMLRMHSTAPNALAWLDAVRAAPPRPAVPPRHRGPGHYSSLSSTEMGSALTPPFAVSRRSTSPPRRRGEVTALGSPARRHSEDWPASSPPADGFRPPPTMMEELTTGWAKFASRVEAASSVALERMRAPRPPTPPPSEPPLFVSSPPALEDSTLNPLRQALAPAPVLPALRAETGSLHLPSSVVTLVQAYAHHPVPAPGTRMVVPLGAAGEDGRALLEGVYGAGGGEEGSATPLPTAVMFVRPPSVAMPAGLGGIPLMPAAHPCPWHLGSELDSGEARACATEWAAPVLFSLLPLDSVLLLLGSMLAEYKVVLVGGSLSPEAVSACALGLHTLLLPLSWSGPFLPTLPAALHEYLSAPVPTLCGVSELPEGWIQDDCTVLVLLDTATVRIPGHEAPHLDSMDRGVPGFLQLQLPGGSALHHTLAEHAAVLRPPTTSSSRQRPCYRASALQLRACAVLMDGISTHVHALLARIFAHELHALHALGDRNDAAALSAAAAMLRAAPPLGERLTALAATEVEGPFWHRMGTSQMVACHFAVVRHAAAWQVARAGAGGKAL